MPVSRKFTVPVTTAADQTATAYSPYFTGYIDSIQYIKTDFANGVDFTITADTTGENIWTQINVDAAVKVSPRQVTQDTSGVEARFVAADAVSPVRDKIALSRDRVKIVIAQGGATKSGSFVITTSEER